MKKIFIKIALLFFLALVVVSPVLAQLQGPSSQIEDIPDDDQFVTMIVSIVLWLMVYAFALSVLFIVVAGILYITSAGNATYAEYGKKTITYAITGLVISLVGYFLVVAISGILFGNVAGGIFGIFG